MAAISLIFVSLCLTVGGQPVRHLIAGQWKYDACDTSKEQALSCLRSLPGKVPEILAYQVGEDIGVTKGNYDFGLIGAFSNVSSFQAYEDSQEHQHCLSLLKPLLRTKAGVEYAICTEVPQQIGLRHLIFGRWNETSTKSQRWEALECLQALPQQVPEIITYEVGPDLGVTEGNYDFGLLGSFANVSSFEAYETSAPHKRCLGVLKPLLNAKVGVEFAWSPIIV